MSHRKFCIEKFWSKWNSIENFFCEKYRVQKLTRKHILKFDLKQVKNDQKKLVQKFIWQKFRKKFLTGRKLRKFASNFGFKIDESSEVARVSYRRFCLCSNVAPPPTHKNHPAASWLAASPFSQERPLGEKSQNHPKFKTKSKPCKYRAK